jgi:hypothetical protein
MISQRPPRFDTTSFKDRKWKESIGFALENLSETIDDRVAALLVAGSNITLTYNDAANTLTIAASGGGGGGYTQEEIEDFVGAMVVAGDGIAVTYNDGAGTLTIALDMGSLAGTGRKTVATPGTAEAIAGSTSAKRVIVTAETDNTDLIVVGDSTVVAALGTRRGIPLAPGQTTDPINVTNLNQVYLDVLVAGEGATYVYEA